MQLSFISSVALVNRWNLEDKHAVTHSVIGCLEMIRCVVHVLRGMLYHCIESTDICVGHSSESDSLTSYRRIEGWVCKHIICVCSIWHTYELCHNSWRSSEFSPHRSPIILVFLHMKLWHIPLVGALNTGGYKKFTIFKCICLSLKWYKIHSRTLIGNNI